MLSRLLRDHLGEHRSLAAPMAAQSGAAAHIWTSRMRKPDIDRSKAALGDPEAAVSTGSTMLQEACSGVSVTARAPMKHCAFAIAAAPLTARLDLTVSTLTWSCASTQADAEAALKRKHSHPEHHAKKARLSAAEARAAATPEQPIDLDLWASDSEWESDGSLGAPQRKRLRSPEAGGGARTAAGPQRTAAAPALQRPGAPESLHGRGAAGGLAAPQAAPTLVPEGSGPATAAEEGPSAGALSAGGPQARAAAAGGAAAGPPARPGAALAVPRTAEGRAALAAAMEVEAAGLRQAFAALQPLAPLAAKPRTALNRAEV